MTSPFKLRRFVAPVLATIILCTFPIAASAQNDTSSSHESNNNENFSLKMVTGSTTGTYYRFGQEIQEALGQDGVAIEVDESTGSIDNIKNISRGEATLGIVQSDVLGFLQRSKEPQSRKLADNLHLVFPFYNEEVHILAGKHIRSLQDLRGKTIVVGPKGSGSWLTAINLLTLTNVKPAKSLREQAEKGLILVLKGQADAMVFVGGKPVTLFKNMDALREHDQYKDLLKNVHILPLTDPRLLTEYAKSTITPEDYSFVTTPVETVAVTAVLVSYGTSEKDNSTRCQEIKAFSDSMFANVTDLKESGHSKWQEVELSADVGTWRREPCSTSENGILENELLNVLRGSE